MDAYQNLANAIIIQTMVDIRKSINTLKRTTDLKKITKALEIIGECLTFFSSEWYLTLTDIDSSIFIANIKDSLYQLIIYLESKNNKYSDTINSIYYILNNI